MNYSSTFDSGFSGMENIIGLILMLIFVISFWKLFSKANKPGILAIIPIVNTIVYASIGGVSCLLLILLFVPIVNFFVLFYIHYKVAEAFGEGVFFALGLWILPFIFVPLLAFGDYTYYGEGKSKRKNGDY